MMILLWLWQSMMFYEYLRAELEVQQTSRWLDGKKKKEREKVRQVLLFFFCCFSFFFRPNRLVVDVT